ncbi:FAD-dependent monooxygenase [Streptomyces thermocarboxydus]
MECDLVIGADGAWSAVRRSVSDATPYTGVSFLEAWFHDVTARHPDIAELVGQGSAAAADGERGLFAQRNGGDHVRVYVIQRAPADWITAATWSRRTPAHPRPAAGALPRLVTAYAPAGRRQRRPLRRPPDPCPARRAHLAAQPFRHLLGDAAHLMPPLGVGVNLALLDACELALALARHDTVVRPSGLTRTPCSPAPPRPPDLDGAVHDLVSTELPDFAAAAEGR